MHPQLPLFLWVACLLVGDCSGELFYGRLSQFLDSGNKDITKEYYGEAWLDITVPDPAKSIAGSVKVTVAHNLPIHPLCNLGATAGRCLFLRNLITTGVYMPQPTNLTNLIEAEFAGDGGTMAKEEPVGTVSFNTSTDMGVLRTAGFKMSVLYDEVEKGSGGKAISGWLLPVKEETEMLYISTPEFDVEVESYINLQRQDKEWPAMVSMNLKPKLIEAGGTVFTLKAGGLDVMTLNLADHPNTVTQGIFWNHRAAVNMKTAKWQVADSVGVVVSEGVAADDTKNGFFEFKALMQPQQTGAYNAALKSPLPPLADGVGEIHFTASINTTNMTAKMRYEIVEATTLGFEEFSNAGSKLEGVLKLGGPFRDDGADAVIVAELRDGWVWFRDPMPNPLPAATPVPMGLPVLTMPEPYTITDEWLNRLLNSQYYVSLKWKSSTNLPEEEHFRGQLGYLRRPEAAATRVAEMHTYFADRFGGEGEPPVGPATVEQEVALTDEYPLHVYEQPLPGLLRVRNYGATAWGVLEGFRSSVFRNETYPPSRMAAGGAATAFDPDVVAQVMLNGGPISVGGTGGWLRLGGLIRHSLFERSLMKTEGKIGRKNRLFWVKSPTEKTLPDYGARGAFGQYAARQFSAALASNEESGYFALKAETYGDGPNDVRVSWNFTHTIANLDGAAGCSRNFSCLVLAREGVVVANLLRGRHAGPAREKPISGVVVPEDIDAEVVTEQATRYQDLLLVPAVSSAYTLRELANDVQHGDIDVVLLTKASSDIKTGGYFSSRLAPSEPPRSFDARGSGSVSRVGVLLSTMQLAYDVAAADNPELAKTAPKLDKTLLLSGPSGSYILNKYDRNDKNAVSLPPYVDNSTLPTGPISYNRVYKGATKAVPFCVIRDIFTGAAGVVTSRFAAATPAVKEQQRTKLQPVCGRTFHFYARLLQDGGVKRRTGNSYDVKGIDVFFRAIVDQRSLVMNYSCGGCGDAFVAESRGQTIKLAEGTAGMMDKTVTLTPRMLGDLRAGWWYVRAAEGVDMKVKATILTDEATDQVRAVLVPAAAFVPMHAYYAESELSITIHPSSGIIEHTLVIPPSIRCTGVCAITGFGSFTTGRPIYSAPGSSYHARFENVLPTDSFAEPLNPPVSSRYLLTMMQGRLGELSAAEDTKLSGSINDPRGVKLTVDAVYPGPLVGFLRRSYQEYTTFSCGGNKGKMQGLQVVPPVDSPFTGEISFTLNAKTGKIHYLKAESSVPQVKGLYLAVGRLGNKGETMHVITGKGQQFTADLDVLRAVLSGYAYATVIPFHHNALGELRCQMVPDPTLSPSSTRKNLYVDGFTPSDSFRQADPTGIYAISDNGAMQKPPWIALLQLEATGVVVYQISTLAAPSSFGEILLQVDPNADSENTNADYTIDPGANKVLARLTKRGDVAVPLSKLNETWGSVVHAYPWEAVLMRKSTFVRFDVITDSHKEGELSGTVRSSSEGSIFTTVWTTPNWNPVYEDIKVDFIVADFVTPFFYGFDVSTVGLSITCNGAEILNTAATRTSVEIVSCLRSGVTNVVITNTTASGAINKMKGVVVPDDVAPIYNFESKIDSSYLVPDIVTSDNAASNPKIRGRLVTQVFYAGGLVVSMFFDYKGDSSMREEFACSMKTCGDAKAAMMSCVNLYTGPYLVGRDTGATSTAKPFDLCDPLFSVPTDESGGRGAVPLGGFLSVGLEGHANDKDSVLNLALNILAERTYVLFHTKTFGNGVARGDLYRTSPLSNLGMRNETTNLLTDISFTARMKVSGGAGKAPNTTTVVKLAYNRLTQRLYSDYCRPSDGSTNPDGSSNHGCVFAYVTLFGGGRSNLTNILLGEFPNAGQVDSPFGSNPTTPSSSDRAPGGFVFFSGDKVSEGLVSAMVGGRLQVASNGISGGKGGGSGSQQRWKDTWDFEKEEFAWIFLDEPVDAFMAEPSPAYMPVPAASTHRNLVSFAYNPSSLLLRYDIFVDPRLVGKRCYGAGCVVLQSKVISPLTKKPVFSAALIDLYDDTMTATGADPTKTPQFLRAEYHGFIPASTCVLEQLRQGELNVLISDISQGTVTSPGEDDERATMRDGWGDRSRFVYRAVLEQEQEGRMLDTASLTQARDSSIAVATKMTDPFRTVANGYFELVFMEDDTRARITLRHNMKLGPCPIATGCLQLRLAPYGRDGSLGAVILTKDITSPPLSFVTKPLPVATIRALKNGWAYVDVVTVKFPMGAVRGQIVPYAPAVSYIFDHNVNEYENGVNKLYTVQVHIRTFPTGSMFMAKVQVFTNFSVQKDFLESEENQKNKRTVANYNEEVPLASIKWNMGSQERVYDLDVNKNINYVNLDPKDVFFTYFNTSTFAVRMKGPAEHDGILTSTRRVQEGFCRECTEFFAELETYNTAPSAAQNCRNLGKASCLLREVCSWQHVACVPVSGFVAASYDAATRSLSYTLSYNFNVTMPVVTADCMATPKPGCVYLQLGTPGITQIESQTMDKWIQTSNRPTSMLPGMRGTVRLSTFEAYALIHGGLHVNMVGSDKPDGVVRGALLPPPVLTGGDIEAEIVDKAWAEALSKPGGDPATISTLPDRDQKRYDPYKAVRGVKYPLDRGVFVYLARFEDDPHSFFHAEFIPGTGDLQGVGVLRYVLRHIKLPQKCVAPLGCAWLEFAAVDGKAYSPRVLFDYGRPMEFDGEEDQRRVLRGEVQITGAMAMALTIDNTVSVDADGNRVGSGVGSITPRVVVADELGRVQDRAAVRSDASTGPSAVTPGPPVEEPVCAPSSLHTRTSPLFIQASPDDSGLASKAWFWIVMILIIGIFICCAVFGYMVCTDMTFPPFARIPPPLSSHHPNPHTVLEEEARRRGSGLRGPCRPLHPDQP